MDKVAKRNTRKNKLVYYITIPLTILLLLSNALFIKLNYDLENTVKTNTEIESNKKNEYIKSNESIKLIEEELNIVKNLNEEIENAKAEYYKTLKTFEDKVLNKELDYKIAYLTFDDGPYNLTHKYLEVLEQYVKDQGKPSRPYHKTGRYKKKKEI